MLGLLQLHQAVAERLNAENLRRQDEEAAIVAEARTLVETDLDVGLRTLIVVAGEGHGRRNHARTCRPSSADLPGKIG
ncbi:MAG: hypothetical protein ACRD26_14985 [Vicinamibacterales bacterium]